MWTRWHRVDIYPVIIQLYDILVLKHDQKWQRRAIISDPSVLLELMSFADSGQLSEE